MFCAAGIAPEPREHAGERVPRLSATALLRYNAGHQRRASSRRPDVPRRTVAWRRQPPRASASSSSYCVPIARATTLAISF